MKPARISRDQAAIDEIVRGLKSVPRGQLRIVRELVDVVAKPAVGHPNGVAPKTGRKKSLLDSQFCGMWEDRVEVGDGKSYARVLKQRLESRGDRT